MIVSRISLLLLAIFASLNLAAQDAPPGPLSDPEEQYRWGEGYYIRGQYAQAADKFKDVVRNFPTFDKRDKACFFWAESHRRNNELEKALSVFMALLKNFPQSQYSHRGTVIMGSILLDKSRNDEALKVLRAADKMNLSADIREEVNYFLGMALNRLGASEDAMNAFRKLPATFDSEHQYRPYAVLNAAYLLRNLGRVGEARTSFTVMAEGENVSKNVREEAIFQLGDIAFVAEDYEEAVRWFDRLLKEFPEGTYAKRARLNYAWSLHNNEKFQDLVNLMKDAPAEELTVDMHYLLGSASKQLSMYQVALDHMLVILNEHPKSKFAAYSQFNVLECHYRLKQYEETIQQARSYVEKFPGHQHAPDASYFLAQSLYQLNRLDEAAAAFEKLIANYAKGWDYKEDALFLLAEVYEKSGDPSKGAATLRQVLDLEGAKYAERALLMAAEAELRASNPKQAIADYQAFIDRFGNSEQLAGAIINMAEIETRQEEYEKAIALLEQFLGKFEGHHFVPRAHYMRGSLNYGLSKFEDAIRDLRKASEFPGFPERDYARLVMAYALWELSQDKKDGETEKESLDLFAELLSADGVKADFVPEILVVIGERYIQLNDYASARRCYALLAENEHAITKLHGKLGLAKIAFSQQEWQQARELFFEVRKDAGEDLELRGEALSYLGETLRMLGKDDDVRLEEARVIFDSGLGLRLDSPTTKSRLRLGLANVLFAQGDDDGALDWASSVYIIYNDPNMAPDAMMMAIQIMVKRDDLKTARAVRKELADRFPGKLATYENKAEYAELFGKLAEPTTLPAP
jgi:TolA-binding protein